MGSDPRNKTSPTVDYSIYCFAGCLCDAVYGLIEHTISKKRRRDRMDEVDPDGSFGAIDSPLMAGLRRKSQRSSYTKRMTEYQGRTEVGNSAGAHENSFLQHASADNTFISDNLKYVCSL